MRSAPGEGTEVELEMQRAVPEAEPSAAPRTAPGAARESRQSESEETGA